MNQSKRVRILDKLVTFFDDWSCIGLDLSEFTFEDIQIYRFKGHTTSVIWHGKKFRPDSVRRTELIYSITLPLISTFFYGKQQIPTPGMC